MKYFKDNNQINPDIQVLKRQVVFKSPGDDAVAHLHIVDTKADGKVIKLLHNIKVEYLSAFNYVMYSCLCIDFKAKD